MCFLASALRPLNCGFGNTSKLLGTDWVSDFKSNGSCLKLESSGSDFLSLIFSLFFALLQGTLAMAPRDKVSLFVRIFNGFYL